MDRPAPCQVRSCIVTFKMFRLITAIIIVLQFCTSTPHSSRYWQTVPDKIDKLHWIWWISSRIWLTLRASTQLYPFSLLANNCHWRVWICCDLFCFVYVLFTFCPTKAWFLGLFDEFWYIRHPNSVCHTSYYEVLHVTACHIMPQLLQCQLTTPASGRSGFKSVVRGMAFEVTKSRDSLDSHAQQVHLALS